MTTDMPTRYDPAASQARWYSFWQENGYFRPSLTSDAPTFVITIPPPNVTGDLHMGHALTYGIEDVIGRFKRMQGYNTLILPGMDHAGIATQNVVEKQLARDGLSRHDLGRERFIERVWEWKAQSGESIKRQFEALGMSFDWSRERFTMDAGYVDAVQEFFIRLFEEGKIYRGWRVINWCVRCHSAISDIEVADDERVDTLYYLRYPLADGEGFIEVATVRPETILGDVAVAVHPDDARYADLVGKTALLPLMDRPLKIIADEMVSPEFGTGAVKITPAHDFADFETGQRHHLDMPIAISPEGHMTAFTGPYEGETVQEARESVLRDLSAGGFLVKTEPISHVVPTCDRCGTLLEPLLSEQWFVRMKELAQPAIEAARSDAVQFVPPRWERVYLEWMENIRDWTISRQLWWGHRIPIYYCSNGHAVASRKEPERCTSCGGAIVRQDEDVLDTWFSSALWPFATLGWPYETEDLAKFYPTSFMNTSSQILYLWIARMIMTGIKFMGEVPFPTVLINPTILNEKGQRMSKSLGTGVDPLDLVAEYGADALRFGLMTSGSTHQQEIRFSGDRVEQARNFGNKVWNVARFILSNSGDEPGTLCLTDADRWILSRLNGVIAQVTRDLEAFELSGAGNAVFDFVWSELADWYVEMAKLRLYNDADIDGTYTVRAVLWSVLERVVRLLQPYMPFLAEEIWQHLRQTGSDGARRLSGWERELPASVMIASWPTPGEIDEGAETSINLLISVVKAVRAVRSEYRVEPAKFIPATAVGDAHAHILHDFRDIVARLARVQPLSILDNPTSTPQQAVSVMVDDITLYLPLAEMTDIEAERHRLAKDLQAARAQQGGAAAKLSSSNFVSRAPEEVVVREREREASLRERIRQLEERLEALGV